MDRRSFAVGLLSLSILFSCVKPSPKSIPITPQQQQDALLLYKAGVQKLQTKQFNPALEDFIRVVSQYPSSSSADNAYLRIGQIYALQNRKRSAAESYQKLIRDYPDSDVYDPALRDLGHLYFEAHRLDDGLRYYSQIQLDKLRMEDQRKIVERSTQALQQTKDDSLAIKWLIALDQSRYPSKPSDLRQTIQEKISQSTSASAMEEIIKQQKAEFPAGYAAAQRFRIANRDGNRNQTQNWGEFYLKNFPHHEHAKEISDLLSALNEDADVDPLAIGLLLPLSGKIKQIASQAMAGATVAMNVFSSSEQTAPHPIKLFVKDIGDGDPESTRNALKSLISEHHVIAVVGPLTSKATQSISQMAQDYHVPVISLSPSEDLTDSGNTIFRNGLTKKEQAIALAQLSAQLLNIKRAAILYPENKYGSEFKQLFWEEFEKYGGEIRGSESYNRDDTSFASPIRKLVGLEPKELRSGEICSPSQEKLYQQNKANPDLSASPSCYPYDELPPIIDFEAIFIPDSFDKARQILPALKYYDVRGVQVLGTNLWNTDGFLEGTTGQDLEGVIFMDSFFPMKKTAEVERFVEHFKADYDYAPSIHAAQTFDAIRALMWIMEKNSPRSRSAMISRLYQFKGYEGVTGLVGFGANREAIRNITPLMVQDKKVVELY